ncbi:MAG: NAD-dependent epimerase/dehydratase family protein [Legionella sp.]|nr:NAD-dependent epimerase/dehydratase family protein [Legionella sp.]
MHHLILGYGYCGFYLANYLLSLQHPVTAVSRHLDNAFKIRGLKHLKQDINEAIAINDNNLIIYYLIPPPATGIDDTILQEFLQKTALKPAKIIYFGSSAVYGDHQGAWIDEQAPLHLTHDRQYRRLNAEQQWQAFCREKNIDGVNLRIAGIYGPDRLPTLAARNQTGIIEPQSAPYTNHIYVKDLAKIATFLALTPQAKGVFNIADGNPSPMGSLQQEVAKVLKLPPAPLLSFEQALKEASPMKREYLQASKRLRIDALETILTPSLSLTPLPQAVSESLAKEEK